MRDRRVPPRLHDHPVSGVDQQDRELRRRRRGDHVARVLVVAGRVGDDELAQGRGEVPVCHVDGDPLLALRDEPVGEQREVETEAAPLRRALDGGELVGENRLGVVEEPTDQRALAVVDAARGEEAQHAVVQHVGIFHRRHQKYPAFFRNSIEASCVWSSRRVAPRSVIVVAAVSATIASTVSAIDATGAVQLMSPTVRKRTETFSTTSFSRGGVSGVTATSAVPRRTTGRVCAK